MGEGPLEAARLSPSKNIAIGLVEPISHISIEFSLKSLVRFVGLPIRGRQV